MALYDREIETLERMARELGRSHTGRMLVEILTSDQRIYDQVTRNLDPADWGEHESDLDNPNDDDVSGVADAFREALEA